MGKKIEILAPAGSPDRLKAAVSAGADAVYAGGSRFGARAYADNFNQQELLEAIDYVHLHQKKIYLTVNTLLKEKELSEELYDYLDPFYRQGIDGVIVQDIGALSYIKTHFPDLPIHASTQMTITGSAGVSFLSQEGVSRVVLARELSLEEVRQISRETEAEIECFVHGALCYCYSGQCLYSSLIGGRSGNRGQCAQPCRLPYQIGTKKAEYQFSLKDICTLDQIPLLVESGITSFKIEGRMKKPEYVAAVTAMYRKYTDLYLSRGADDFQVQQADISMLLDIYNRGGFHSGYLHQRNGRDMLSLSRPNHAGTPVLRVQKSGTVKAYADIHKGDVIEIDGLENYTFGHDVKKGEQIHLAALKNKTLGKGASLYRIRNEQLLCELKERYLSVEKKEKLKGKLILSIGNPAKLILQYADVKVEVAGDVIEAAVNQPMTEERIEKQMHRTGSSAFDFESLEVMIDGEVFIPVQSLNELRRKGLKAMSDAIVSRFRRKGAVQCKKPGIGGRSHGLTCIQRSKQMSLFVSVENEEQYHSALKHPEVSRIYIEDDCLPEFEDSSLSESGFKWRSQAQACGKKLFLAMPHIFRNDAKKRYRNSQKYLSAFDGILIRNYESISFLKELKYTGEIVTDHHLYIFNSQAKQFWMERGVSAMTVPLELNRHEIAELDISSSEMVVYGFLPMMVTAGCVRQSSSGCRGESGYITVTDRRHKEFMVKNCCKCCYNIVYNATPLWLGDCLEEIREYGAYAIRLSFSSESGEQMDSILGAYAEAMLTGKPVLPTGEFTRGHFKRGIK